MLFIGLSNISRCCLYDPTNKLFFSSALKRISKTAVFPLLYAVRQLDDPNLTLFCFDQNTDVKHHTEGIRKTTPISRLSKSFQQSLSRRHDRVIYMYSTPLRYFPKPKQLA